MTKRKAAARRTESKRSRLGATVRQRPWILAVGGLALGAVVGSFLKFTPEQKQALGERAGKLKKEAAKLKDGVSELAVESYEQAQNILEGASESLSVSGKDGSGKSLEQNPLIINDSGR
ncbi:MAG: hypothetical protein JOY77_00625 [Alphaproteobacteria bacterium]|nr:hypothetical protein [Alphaproteobacteria bacterium]